MRKWFVLLFLPAVSPAAMPSPPLYFEENRGQSAAEVRFLASGSPGIFFTRKETVVAFSSGDVLRIRPEGAAPFVLEPLEPLPGKSNYLNREPGITGVKHYGRIRYRSVYPGIDLLFYGHGNELEYDFAISPGARPERIRLTLQGANELRIDTQGNLVARLQNVSFIQRRPEAWQSGDDGVPHRVEVSFVLTEVLTGKKQVTFAIGAYDRSRPLIIDPLVDYATYLGTAGPPFQGDVVSGIAADSAGNAYITGNAQSGKFPSTSGGVPAPTSGNAGFVAKLSADGANLVYSTYLNLPPAQAIAVDSQGSAYVTGSPTGNANVNYIVKLTPDGSAFTYSHTFANNLGGSSLSHLLLDSAQNVYVSGTTSDTRFPTTSGSYQSSFPGQIGLFGALSAYGFVIKLNTVGNVVYSTYLRDPVPFNGNTVQFLAVDGNQDAMILTVVPSSSAGQGPQAMLLKLNPSGSGALSTLTFPNASTPINVLNFGTDPAGNLYVIGGGSLSSNSAGPLIAELDSNGIVVKGRYLEVTSGNVFVDSSGNAYVVGNEPGAGTPFITRVDSSFSTDTTFFPSITPASSTSLPDTLQFVALDAAGNLYLTLSNPVFGQSPHFPATPGAYQTAAGAFAVVKLDAAAMAAGTFPTVAPGGVTNAGSGQALFIAPGEILAVYGANMGPAQLISAAFDANGRLPTSLAGTQLLVGGVPVPLLYTSANQIAGIAPLSLAAALASPGPPPFVSIQVGYQGIGSSVMTNSLVAIPAVPGLFTSDASGHGQGAILNQDGSINSVAHPAPPGSVVSLFCSGCGITSPLGTDGTVATSIASLANPIGVTIGGQVANVQYAGSAPGLVNGAIQINVTVPTGISGDALPIGISAPGAPPTPLVTMAVH